MRSGSPGALRLLVRSFADPAVGYVSGRASYEAPDGTNREGAYWRFELWLRMQESRLGSITAGNGPIYAVRRSDWVELEPWCGHDLGLPYLMVQRGRRAVYDPDAVSVEKPSRDIEDEYRRKVRMLRGAWVHVFRGMLRRVGPSLLRRARVAPAPALRERDPAPRAAGLERRARRRGLGLSGCARRAAAVAPARRSRPAAAADPGRRARLLLPRRHVGDAGRAWRATSASGRRCSGSGSRARGEPRARRRRRLARSRAREPRCWPSRRSRSSWRIGAACSTGSSGSARTGASSSS